MNHEKSNWSKNIMTRPIIGPYVKVWPLDRKEKRR